MKKNISSIELAVLLKEISKELKDSKIDKIYLIPPKEILLQTHVTGKGKRILRINVPTLLYLSETKPEAPEKPHGYCMFLRKRLGNARIRSFNQLDFERIFEVNISTKDTNYKLIFEMFSKGNVILCDENYKIISPLENQKWSQRVVKPKEQYVYPKSKYNFLTIKEDDLKELIKQSNKDSIVKALAMDLGLGGIYAEELCIKAKIKKDKKTADNNTIKRLFEQVKELRKLKTKPFITKKKELLPFELYFHKDEEKTYTKTFNEALDKIFTTTKHENKLQKKTTKHDKEITKIEKVIKIQEKQISSLENQYKDNTEKGEFIYSNYQTINDILEQLKTARKTMSWKDIKKKLKGHKIIKQINEKNSEINIEI